MNLGFSIHQAAKEGHVAWLKKASKRDINRGDEDGWTAVHWGAWNGSEASLQVILDRGGNFHKADDKGNNPLHIAAAYGNLVAVELLITNGANLFALDDYGRTAARVAAFYQKADCCRYLDTLGIRWQVQNSEGVAKLQIKAMKELRKRSKKTEESKYSKPSRLNYEYATAPTGGRHSIPSTKPRPASTAEGPGGSKDKKLSTKDVMLQNFELRQPLLLNSEVANLQSNSEGSTMRNLSDRQSGPLLNNLYQLPLNIEPSYEARHSMLHPFHSSSEGQLIQKKGRGLPELELTGGHPTVTKNESALATFLNALDLPDCVQLLHREKLDLDALNMCSEEDLISIGLSLGPRKKILNGIARRKAMLAGTGKLVDTEF